MLRRNIPLQQRKHHRRKVTVLGVEDNTLQRGGARQERPYAESARKEVIFKLSVEQQKLL